MAWIFLNDAFLSIVIDKGSKEGDLLVRARRREDIERTFPAARVWRTPSRDYGWRSTIPRQVVAAAIASAVSTIDYDNFKDSVRENDRHDAYLRVWSTMEEFQKPKGKRPALFGSQFDAPVAPRKRSVSR